MKNIPSPFSLSGRLIPTNHDLPCRGDLAVELLCVVAYLDSEGLFVDVEFEIGRHSPRVPAGAVSTKGHDALGHLLAVGPRDDNLGIERYIYPNGMFPAVRPR